MLIVEVCVGIVVVIGIVVFVENWCVLIIVGWVVKVEVVVVVYWVVVDMYGVVCDFIWRNCVFEVLSVWCVEIVGGDVCVVSGICDIWGICCVCLNGV